MVTVLLAVQSISFCVYFKEFERVVQHHLLYVSVCLSVFPPVCLSVASFSLFYPTVCIVMFFLVQDVAK
jgi:hypothetical protein